METLFRKVLTSERLPNESGEYDTDLKRLEYFEHLKAWRFDFKPKWWLEEIQLPSEEGIELKADNVDSDNSNEYNQGYFDGFMKCSDYILGIINNKK